MNSDRYQYRLLACGDGRKIEKFGDQILDRPSTSAIWQLSQEVPLADSRFERKTADSGVWTHRSKKTDKSWMINLFGIKLALETTPFGHIGLFPEHLNVFDRCYKEIFIEETQPLKVLHLFAYTGALSLKMAALGAKVTHVDSSKAALAWAKKNYLLNDLDQGIRWIEEDVQKFVSREVRRGEKYDFIVLDPPSFGRGAKNEVWKTDSHLRSHLEALTNLRSSEFKGILLTSHSAGHSAKQLENLLKSVFQMSEKDFIESFEMEIEAEVGPSLPAGFAAFLAPQTLKGRK